MLIATQTLLTGICEKCTAPKNPEQLLFGKTEDMPEGHMWQWFLTV